MARIAFVVQLPEGISPAQRFRVEAWEPTLRQAGHLMDTYSFIDENAARILYRPGRSGQKILAVLSGFWKRLTLTLKIRRYDYIFLQREAAPVGPPLLEWIWARLLRRKVIYDFDDAIWIPNTSSENRLATRFKASWKVGSICSWATIVSAGNDFLCDYARSHSTRAKVIRIPTVVDTVARYDRTKAHSDHPIVVGWTGSHSTLKYLDEIIPVISKLQEELSFTFMVIADKKPDLPFRQWEFIPWNTVTEIDDLLKLDIGIMPLTPDPWSEGKCGFKLIQYLALGIPAVASPVGVNKDVITDGITGYLAEDAAQWEAALRTLITDTATRQRMGAAGRVKIEADYSLNSQREKFLGMFET